MSIEDHLIESTPELNITAVLFSIRNVEKLRTTLTYGSDGSGEPVLHISDGATTLLIPVTVIPSFIEFLRLSSR